MRIARRMAPKAVPIGMPEGTPPQLEMAIERFRASMGPVLDKAILIAAAVFAFINGTAMASQWETFRLWLGRVPFNIRDPQFGQDVGFYVFSLPVNEVILAWTTDILLLTLVLAALVHLVDGAIQPWAKLKGFSAHVKAHLSVLAAMLVLTRAYAYWIDIYQLNFSPRGQVVGASYTDVNAQLPAYRILIVISIVTAGLAAAQHPLPGVASAGDRAGHVGGCVDRARRHLAWHRPALRRDTQRGLPRSPLHRAQHPDDA